MKVSPELLKRNALYAGGLLIVMGAILPLAASEAAPWIFAAGALLFAPVQLLERAADDAPLAVRRLVRQRQLAAVLLLVTAALMFCSFYGIRPFSGGEWKVTLAIAAFIEVYTAFRLG